MSRLRAPSKMELAGIAVFALGVWWIRADQHEGRDWMHIAGVAGWMLLGVILFVGDPALRLLKGAAGLPGYARREWRKRTSTTVSTTCKTCKKNIAFCLCPEGGSDAAS